ncbi:MAG: hypothetical protein C0177_07325 [Fervidicoccus fontis]|nr:MAG: hypothetical protein C0177_07325 [Fervidicoccus fontis]
MEYTWQAVHDVLDKFGSKALDTDENVKMVFEAVLDGKMVFSKYDFKTGDVKTEKMSKEYFIHHLSREALKYYVEKYGWR